MKSTDFHNSFTAAATVNTFSSVKKMKSAANWENFFRSSLRAVQFAYSQLLRTSPLKAFELQILSCDALNRWLRNACLQWYFMDCAVSSVLVLLTQKHIVHLVSVFIRAVRAFRCLSLPWRLSTVPVSLNFFNNLLMLLVIRPLSGNFVLNCLALYSFTWYIFH